MEISYLKSMKNRFESDATSCRSEARLHCSLPEWNMFKPEQTVYWGWANALDEAAKIVDEILNQQDAKT